MFPTIGPVNGADTAWLLAAFALVLLMTPGLALFYGGMVRSKSVLNMMMMCLTAIPVVWVLWLVFGYSMAFGPDKGGVVGIPTTFAGLRGLIGGFTASGGDRRRRSAGGADPRAAVRRVPGRFAMVTVALIAGAVADRMRFLSWLVFAGAVGDAGVLPGGALGVLARPASPPRTAAGSSRHLGAIDFAGGTAVEINSGASALVMALFLGRRAGWPRDPMRPHNLPFVMLGAGLLWFGWFGFNAGPPWPPTARPR